MRKIFFFPTLALIFIITTGAVVFATIDDGALNDLQLGTFDHQHGVSNGHLPAVQRNVQLVGHLDLFADEEQPARVSDVAAFGNYAYLGGFYQPDCDGAGVFVLDISDPAQPTQVAFIPADPESYVGEGVQVLDVNTASFTGQVLVHNNESCFTEVGATGAGLGGASLWDVSDPLNPKLLAAHVGDIDPGGTSAPHDSHSAFGWQQGNNAYLVVVDNEEFGSTDIDIFDITDPKNPVMVLETGLSDFPQILESPPPSGNRAFIHDMVVKKVGEQYLLLGSYWDGGYIILDVTNLPNASLPKTERAKFLRDTDFGAVEPFRAEMGLPEDWTPEGNAHQAEFSHKSDLFLGADEDFGPRRLEVMINSGTYQGHASTASLGNDVPSVDPENPVSGPTTFVGLACTALPPAASPDHIALIERGVCTFTMKAQNAQAAGYKAGIVFNEKVPLTGGTCESLANMSAAADIPFVFVARSHGLRILNQEFSNACEKDAPLGATSSDVTLRSNFDGWGYLHLYNAGTMEAIDHWALPESLDADKAVGFGHLSIHEVATDPKRNVAYVSHYSGGLRVFEFDKEQGLTEVGAYIHEGGNNFWGVEVHYLPGHKNPVILASDRDAGLWIFRYGPPPK